MATFSKVKRKLYYLSSPALRLLIRRIYYFPIDVYDRISGRAEILIPPKGKIFVGAGEFKKTGEELLKQVIATCGMTADARVLDVGCGIGRVAVPLIRFLSDKGSYEGFDIVKQGIKWCKNNITPQYPNFTFLHVDLRNDLYNLKAENKAQSFQFPYGDCEFDQVILTSVFTHMMPDDLNNYLDQISRVMKPGGKCFATFFLLDNNTRSLTNNKHSVVSFPYSYGYYSLMDRRVKEANIAYDKSWLFDNILLSKGLAVEAVYDGWWSGRNKEKSLGFQDIVILAKRQ